MPTTARWVSDSTCLSCRNISYNSIGTYNKRLIKHQTTRRRRNNAIYSVLLVTRGETDHQRPITNKTAACNNNIYYYYVYYIRITERFTKHVRRRFLQCVYSNSEKVLKGRFLNTSLNFFYRFGSVQWRYNMRAAFYFCCELLSRWFLKIIEIRTSSWFWVIKMYLCTKDNYRSTIKILLK